MINPTIVLRIMAAIDYGKTNGLTPRYLRLNLKDGNALKEHYEGLTGDKIESNVFVAGIPIIFSKTAAKTTMEYEKEI